MIWIGYWTRWRCDFVGAGRHRVLRGRRERAMVRVRARSSPPIPSDETFKEEDNLNDLIKEIFHDNPTASDLSKSSPSAVTNGAGLKNFSRAKVRKCSPVYLGGSSESYGLGTNTSHRTCDQLRCTTCDFRVITLDDYEWDKSCNYIFFRNNMPDLNKLKGKAVRKSGARAYACQCSWSSIQNLTDLRDEQHLRWVCGKH
ncbi:cilia- and flagella-associated protein 418 isoform X2 [Narcine bancroftii]|uniref:cilia- and flagella-associated protein 418 isoform X2 n=1 Tax=Narcine bancroftii TaxID=1343680 RepID=UPI003832064D